MTNLKTARANRLTAEQQKQWWADNADQMKGVGAAEISGLQVIGKAKAANAWGYDLTEWYRGEWDKKTGSPQPDGYQTKGLEGIEAVPYKERTVWAESTKIKGQTGYQRELAMMNAKGCETAEPWQHGIEESKGHTYPHKGDEQTWADTRGDLAVTVPSWMGQASPLTWQETKEAQRCLTLPIRSLPCITWTLEEAEPIWWNRHHKGSVLSSDIGAARIDTNKYDKKIAALDKQLKAALADRGRSSNGPVMSLSERYPSAWNAADLVKDTGDVDRRKADELTEELGQWLTDKEMEALQLKAHGMAQTDTKGGTIKRAVDKARKALRA